MTTVLTYPCCYDEGELVVTDFWTDDASWLGLWQSAALTDLWNQWPPPTMFLPLLGTQKLHEQPGEPW